MFPIAQSGAPGAAGFTLIEAMVVLAIFGAMLAVGVPSMSRWNLSNKAAAGTEFYAEGFKLARAQAIAHNGASRIVLSENGTSGKMDWQVDLCFPTAALPCSDESGAWSSVDASAGNDPEGAAGFKSVFRSAAALPGNAVLQQSITPAGASALYFTALGWVDTNFAPRLGSITMTPAAGYADDIPNAAIVVTLSGNTTKCDPSVAPGDSRACPP